MVRYLVLLGAVATATLGCSQRTPASPAIEPQGQPARNPTAAEPGGHATDGSPLDAQHRGEWHGFDRNDYPGDSTMASLRTAPASFAFTGYWLTNPPGESTNTWAGKRSLLRQQGWGFLVLANGRLDREILKAQKTGTAPAMLGSKDAATAMASARHEGFPSHTLVFLDQEEGGRLLPEQAAYLLGWTEAVARTEFRPGVYASGQRVEDAPGVRIDTIEDVRTRVTAGKLHEVAIFDALDQCPPAPGCTLAAKPLSATPDPGITVWQYAQSPRRPEVTQACGASYARDGNCYAPGFPQLFLDLNVADSADPSNGR